MDDPIHEFRAAILATLGHAPENIEPGRFHRFATSEKHGDSAGWCKLFDDMRGGVFGCMRQGLSETWSAAHRSAMTPQQRAAFARRVMAATAERKAKDSEQWRQNAQRIADLWAQCVPVTDGDPVALYLRRRGLEGPRPEVLKLHAGLPYWHDGKKIGTFPVMVAPVTAPDGRLVTLHRTYLTGDGRKADVPTVKKLTSAAGPLAGACIRLAQPLRGTVGVAEGIETALAASMASGVPTVAAYCAGALAGYSWPSGAQSLVIFADADKAGRASSDELRSRALGAGLRVNVMMPTDEGADWCDVWASRGAVALECAV
jgi:phage/plasmid primase-like uncharacterized protein